MDAIKRMDEIAEENGLTFVETTSEYNGYPANVKDALIGFSNFDEAKRIADENELSLIWINKRDGWNFWHRGDTAYEPMTISTSDFGDDFEFEDDAEKYMEMAREIICELCESCSSLKEIRTFIDNVEEVADAIENLEDGQTVVTCCGKYYDTIDVNPISFYYDTKYTELAAIKI